jgi:hypothetical protein
MVTKSGIKQATTTNYNRLETLVLFHVGPVTPNFQSETVLYQFSKKLSVFITKDPSSHPSVYMGRGKAVFIMNQRATSSRRYGILDKCHY